MRQAKATRMTANSVISPELVLVDPELRASLMAAFRVSPTYGLPVLELTTRARDFDRPAFSAVSGNDQELGSKQGPVSLVIAAVVYAVAGLAGILLMGALAITALALLVVMLAWIA
jgi:hypothetical protein